MSYTLLKSLLLNTSFLVLMVHISTRVTVLKRQILNNVRDRKGCLLLIFFFSFLSILATYMGVGVNGAIVNTRASCVLSAGMIGGPVVGMTTAVITGLHRLFFDIGGFTSLACACSTIFVEGILGCLLYRPFQSGKLSWSALVFATGIAELGQMLFILLLARPFLEAVALVKMIVLPMILTNSLGILAFIGAFQYIFLEQKSLADYEVHRAMYIAEQCLPHLRKGLSNVEEMEAATKIICQNSACMGAAITNQEKPLSCYGELCLEEIPAFLHRVMEEGRCMVVERAEQCPELTALFSKYTIVVAPLRSEERASAVGCLVLLEPKQWRCSEREYLFAESLAALFSAQLELSQIAYQKELLRKAEFQRLQSQVDPHFLFNSLNTISFFCRRKPERAKELLLLLAKYYRFSTNQEEDFVPFYKELEQVDIYLQLEKARYEEKLILEQNISGFLQIDLPVPRLLLQPIVENAIRHGVSPDGTHFVGLQIWQTEAQLLIQIADHGSGFPQEVLDNLQMDTMQGDHVGLVNVHRRLKCIYGEKNGLSVESTPQGSTITIQLPLK